MSVRSGGRAGERVDVWAGRLASELASGRASGRASGQAEAGWVFPLHTTHLSDGSSKLRASYARFTLIFTNVSEIIKYFPTHGARC